MMVVVVVSDCCRGSGTHDSPIAWYNTYGMVSQQHQHINKAQSSCRGVASCKHTSHLAIPPDFPETTHASLRGHFQRENPRRKGSAFTAPSSSSSSLLCLLVMSVSSTRTRGHGPEHTVWRFARDWSLSPSPSLYNIPATLDGIIEPVTSWYSAAVWWRHRCHRSRWCGERDSVPRTCDSDVAVCDVITMTAIYDRLARSAEVGALGVDISCFRTETVMALTKLKLCRQEVIKIRNGQ